MQTVLGAGVEPAKVLNASTLPEEPLSPTSRPPAAHGIAEPVCWALARPGLPET